MNAPLSVKFKNDLENDLHADPHKAWFGICSSFENELHDAKAEIKRLTEQLDAAASVHSCGDHCQRPMCKRAMRNAIAEAIPFLESHQDEGPNPYGWQSDELRNLVEKLKHLTQ